MKLPNWAKIVWWLALVLAGGVFVYFRRAPIIGGQGTPIDLFVVGVGTALLLAPLFIEMEFLGLKLKQQIEETKKDLESKIVELRTEIKTSAQSNVTVNQQTPTPPPDDKLHGRLEVIQHAIADLQSALLKQGQETENGYGMKIGDDVAYAFATRYSIERELKRILDATRLPNSRRKMNGVTRLITQLTELEILPPEVANGVRDVYAICSPAIHGEPITEAQLDFLKKLGPDLLQTLRLIDPAPFVRYTDSTSLYTKVQPGTYTTWDESHLERD